MTAFSLAGGPHVPPSVPTEDPQHREPGEIPTSGEGGPLQATAALPGEAEGGLPQP